MFCYHFGENEIILFWPNYSTGGMYFDFTASKMVQKLQNPSLMILIGNKNKIVFFWRQKRATRRKRKKNKNYTFWHDLFQKKKILCRIIRENFKNKCLLNLQENNIMTRIPLKKTFLHEKKKLVHQWAFRKI